MSLWKLLRTCVELERPSGSEVVGGGEELGAVHRSWPRHTLHSQWSHEGGFGIGGIWLHSYLPGPHGVFTCDHSEVQSRSCIMMIVTPAIERVSCEVPCSVPGINISEPPPGHAKQ